ncbi:hypothetical protein CVV26_01365 [Candidatus Kuenenbacteria bacterium HGW-Kuenenbacteria-1]|uniref:Uncharacterized protein n=1 Tax=Candidatus Kuenenbacteria bacterium HGW-Kuenenbacteria-1 TaxID=2013812 RepID=A0A2N1UNP9_9BACT|nr:MAG: hypothetical protein CVV26_01365 [Candidatus Kuenenbacteria bacterium HGW-Kuenenbacteria-1]
MNTQTITIPKKEYQKLIENFFRFEYFKQVVKEDIFASPPIRNTKKIINSFKETNKYNDDFLKSLEKGLKRSSYFI